MALIIIGGIGFLTWEDMKKNKRHLKKYRMQSKVILTVTGLLIFLPAIYFFFYEFSNLPFTERYGIRFFNPLHREQQALTRRFTDISEVGLMLMIVLMLIGGSPALQQAV